jgi:hypothetical protein
MITQKIAQVRAYAVGAGGGPTTTISGAITGSMITLRRRCRSIPALRRVVAVSGSISSAHWCPGRR